LVLEINKELKMKANWQDLNLEKIVEIAENAGKKIIEIYNNSDFSKIVDFKSDNSPLTLADKESHKIIDAALKELAPFPVLSEEGKSVSYEERKNWDIFWLVDPLDGTKEFIKRNGQFTVNIALIEKGIPVMGVIYVPVTEIGYYGKKYSGAFKKEKGKVEKLSVSAKSSDWTAVGSSSHSSSEEQLLLKRYPVTNSVAMGSSLKFCLVAEGKAEIYYRHGPTMEWDTAAGQAIVECSGGVVLDSSGKSFSYNKENLLNGSFLCLSQNKAF
jgi:3'(2'), 5'-bisphosphate nucleotidase